MSTKFRIYTTEEIESFYRDIGLENEEVREKFNKLSESHRRKSEGLSIVIGENTLREGEENGHLERCIE